MGLAEQLLAVFFGVEAAPAIVEVGLARGGVECADPGYRRQVVPRGTWTLDGPVARRPVRFGPFFAQVEVDGAFIAVGGDRTPLPLGGTASLLPGMTLDFDAQVGLV